MEKIKAIISNCFFMLRYVYRSDKMIFIYKSVSIILSGIYTYIGTMYLKWLLDFITKNLTSPKGAVKEFIMLVLLIQMISLLFYSFHTLLSKVIIPRREYVIKNKLQNIFIKKATYQDLSRYEEWEFYDTYTKTVRYADTKALDIFNIFFSLLESIVQILVLISVIVQLDKFVLILVGIMVILTIIDQKFSNKYSYEQYEAEETINREAEYIKKVAHHRQYAKEVRIFNLSEFIINKLNALFVEKYNIFKKINSKYWKLKYIVHTLNTIFLTPALISYIGIRVLFGIISVGSFTVLFSSTFSVSGSLSNLIMITEKMQFESKYYVSKLRKMLELESKIETNDIGIDITEIKSIEFNHVSFHYPNHDQLILNDVCFKIENHEQIAIVGKNGAGKSTIIKLLLRLYDATQGNILINKIPISHYNIKSLRNCFSVVLQDYQILNFSIRDNISLGRNINYEDIINTLSFVELKDRVDKCKNGIDTFVGREFDPEGENFSGGEYQKIAIARGILRKCSCCIFDEANSALDPFADAKINKKIIQQNKDRILLFVTHRLTTAVNATKIIHIENGEIVCIGDHLSLMQRDELYRDMFDSQATLYKTQKDSLKYEQ